MTEPVFQRLAVIGCGLIGGSIALAARERGAAASIAVAARKADTLERARQRGFAETYTHDAAEAVADADCVIICVPVGATGEVAAAIGPALKPGAIVSDAGSVKASVIALARPHLPETVHFIPAHPVAGTEQSGPDAAFAELFDGRWCIFTPEGDVDADALAKLTAFWERLGASVETMDAAHHDLVLAITSHVPHLIAYNIVSTANDLQTVTRSEVMKFAAGGFRDFTRIAASDPTMWRDVFLHNREAVLEMLGRFSEDLTALQRAIRWSDGDALFDLFTKTRAIRRGIIDAGQEADLPDFGRPHGAGD